MAIYLSISELMKRVKNSEGFDETTVLIEIDREDFIKLMMANNARMREIVEEVIYNHERRRIAQYLRFASKERLVYASKGRTVSAKIAQTVFTGNLEMHKHYIKEIRTIRKFFLKRRLPR